MYSGNMANSYFSTAWGARISNLNAKKPEDDEIQVLYQSSENEREPGPVKLFPGLMSLQTRRETESLQPYWEQEKISQRSTFSNPIRPVTVTNARSQQSTSGTRRSEIPMLISTTSSKPSLNQQSLLQTPINKFNSVSVEPNLVFDITQFEIVARQTLDNYGFRDYLCLYTYQSWYSRYVDHIRKFNNRMCNAMDQIERDYGLASTLIPCQVEVQGSQFIPRSRYFGKDYLSFVFAKPHSFSDLRGQNSSSEQSTQSKLKTITTTLQQVLEDPSNGSLSIPGQVNSSFSDKNKEEYQDRNEEKAFKDKWNPVNCAMPFPIFIKHVQWRMETNPKKGPLPHFDIEIFRLRYSEHMSQVEKDGKSLLVSILSAYGDDISTYPKRVMELLKRTSIFRQNSKPFNTDYGSNPKAFLNINAEIVNEPKKDTVLPLPPGFRPLVLANRKVKNLSQHVSPNPTKISSNPVKNSPNPLMSSLIPNPRMNSVPSNPRMNSPLSNPNMNYVLSNPRMNSLLPDSIPNFSNLAKNANSSLTNPQMNYSNIASNSQFSLHAMSLDPPSFSHSPMQNRKTNYENQSFYPSAQNQNSSARTPNIVKPLMSTSDPTDAILSDPTKVLRNPLNSDYFLKKKMKDSRSKSAPYRSATNINSINNVSGGFPLMDEGQDDFSRRRPSEISQGMNNYAFRNPSPLPVSTPHELGQFSFSEQNMSFKQVTPFSRNNMPGYKNEINTGLSQVPKQMKNLMNEAADNSARGNNQSTSEFNSVNTKISFQMPFDVWKVACERSRTKIHNQVSSAPLRTLREEEYKMWYVRYLYYVEENYDNFLEGITSGFPTPNYPQEIRDMIIHRQMMDEGKCDRTKNLQLSNENEYSENPWEDDYNVEDDIEDNPSNVRVIYDYGHSSSRIKTEEEPQLLTCYTRSDLEDNYSSSHDEKLYEYKRRKFY